MTSVVIFRRIFRVLLDFIERMMVRGRARCMIFRLVNFRVTARDIDRDPRLVAGFFLVWLGTVVRYLYSPC